MKHMPDPSDDYDGSSGTDVVVAIVAAPSRAEEQVGAARACGDAR
jgi:hypothetical protein